MNSNARRLATVWVSLAVAVSALGAVAPEPVASAAEADTAASTSTVEANATTADPVIAAVGDIACDPAHSSFNGGNGTSNNCRQKYTSDLVVNQGLAAVLALGDNQYYCGSYDAHLRSYDLSWGRVKSITYPAVGNHEYLTAGGTEPSTGCDSTNAGAAGHFKYWGAAAGDPKKGYYSFDIGSWHIIMLNSSCSGAGGCSATSPQGQWLRNDLATHSNYCTLAFWHVPLFSSGGRASATYKTFWDALYQYGADVVLNGHDHTYERFAPMNPEGTRDDALGIREFVVGSGGSNHTSFVTTAANSEARDDDTYGVLKMTLRAQSYDWEFVPEAGRTFTDKGTGSCHGTTADTTPPSAPTNVTATAVGGSRVDLSWTASTDNVTVLGYKIFRDGNQIATSPTTRYTDKTVQPNTTYSYHVAAYDGAQNTSAPSNTATVTTGPPDELLTFTATADAYVQQDLATSNFGTATSIDIDSSPTKNLLIKFALSGLTGRQITGAKLRLHCVDSSGSGGEFRRVADQSWSETTVTWNNAPAGDTSVLGSLGGVTAGAWYELDVGSLVTGTGSVSVRASSGSSDGARYSSKEGTAGLAPQLVVSVAAQTGDTTPPSAPTNLTASAASPTQVDLSWTASSDNVAVTGYRIYRGTTEIGTSTTTTFSDKTVQPSTTYSYTVKAYDAAGNLSPASNSASVTTPSEQQETLTFTPSDDAYVQQDLASSNFGAATSIDVDTSPVKNLLLKFGVSGVGSRQIVSAKLRVYCVDASPSGGAFRRVANQSWSEGTVNWSNAPAADTTTLGSLAGVAASTWYEVDVTPLVTGDGSVSLRASSSSSDGARYASKEGTAGFAPQLVVTVSGTPPPPDTEAPSAPTGLTATAASPNQVDLSWTASTDNVGVAGYRVYRDGAQIATTTATTYSDKTAAAANSYGYTLKAHDAAGNLSADSNTAITKTPDPQETLTFAPTDDAYVQQDLAGSNFGAATSVQVDNSPVKHLLLKFAVSGIAGRQIDSVKLRLRCVDASPSGGTFHRVADQSWSEGTVTWNNAPAADTGVLASLGSVSSSTWYEIDVTSLVTGDGTVSIRAASSSSDGAQYSSKEGTSGYAPQLRVTVSGERSGDTTPPSAPQNLTATAVSATQIDLSWDASTDDVGVTGYRIYRNGSEIATSETTSYSDKGLQPATTYTYTVRAYDAAGNLSTASNSASASTVPDLLAPTPPLNLVANAVSSTQVDLSWTASTDNVGVAGYRVYRDGVEIATPTGTSYTDRSVAAGTAYTYTVRAYDAAGNLSEPSNEATVTTARVLTFTSTADTYVRSDVPAGNYGGASSFIVDKQPITDGLLKFSVSGVGTGKVLSVKLRLRCVDASNKGGDVRRVANTSWDERAVTWSTAPAADSTVLASLGSVSAGVWYEVDVTSLVTGDGTYSVKISSSSTNGAYYSTKEGTAGFAPQLIVEAK